MNIKILDCTLRDGAHVNNGQFGIETIKNLIHHLVKAKIDIIEIGFLVNKDYDMNTTFFNRVEDCENLIPNSESEFSLLVRPDQYDIHKLTSSDNLDILRFAFYQEDIKIAIDQLKIAKKLGFKVFLNPINVSSYSDDMLKEFALVCKDIMPGAISIVDTFGTLDIDRCKKIYDIFDHSVHIDCKIGLHLHENLNSSFAIAKNFIDFINPARESVIDASLVGMGRNPGNLPLELITNHCNFLLKKNYNQEELLIAISNFIMPIKAKFKWGYSPEYFLSGIHAVHRSYPEFFIEKGKIDMCKCEKLLVKIKNDNKHNHFDENYAKALLKEL